MTANQRRSGFRLPWSSEDEPADETDAPDATAAAAPAETAPTPTSESATKPGTTDAPAAAASEGVSAETPRPATTNGSSPEAVMPADAATAERADANTPAEPVDEPPTEFLHDLIVAMRKVADEARQVGVAELKSRADETVRALESEAEKRIGELRERAETDISGVGEWARAEAERIKAEAEQRVAARRAQLEQQLAAEATRTDAEAKALRARVEDYERELEAFHAQLTEINDPAAFAAAAKRMPKPPPLTPRPAAAARPPVAADTGDGATPAAQPTPVAPATIEPAADAAAEVHPAEEEVLAARLAELDEELDIPAPVAAQPGDDGPITTDVVVKGLGSFGAITGFRQSLAAQEGISTVALSLGQTGEFVFRATHAPGTDVAAAITTLEGDGATIERRPEGGLRVTLERAR